MSVSEPDPATLAAAMAGDHSAFTRLMVAYQDMVWRFLTRFVGDPVLAEDLTQETFLRVYRGIGGYEGRSRFSTWVFGVARNTALDALRRRDRRPVVASSLVDETEPLPRATIPPGTADPFGMTLELRTAIDQLPASQRETLLLVEVLGLNHREAAEITGVPEGTVKSRMYHARRSLHEALDDRQSGDVANGGAAT